MHIAKAEVRQLPGDKDGEIQRELMERPDCRTKVDELISVGRYVCQAQSSFVADVRYDIEAMDANNLDGKLGTHIAKDVLKKASTGVQLTDSGSNSLVGSGLVFGTRMEEVCVTPKWAYFIRTWPSNGFDRAINFVKYSLVEPFVVDRSGAGAEAHEAGP